MFFCLISVVICKQSGRPQFIPNTLKSYPGRGRPPTPSRGRQISTVAGSCRPPAISVYLSIFGTGLVAARGTIKEFSLHYLLWWNGTIKICLSSLLFEGGNYFGGLGNMFAIIILLRIALGIFFAWFFCFFCRSISTWRWRSFRSNLGFHFNFGINSSDYQSIRLGESANHIIS